MPNGMCYHHGGRSTGPRTEAGKAAISAAHLVHGTWSNSAMAAQRAHGKLSRQLHDLLQALHLLDEGEDLPADLIEALAAGG